MRPVGLFIVMFALSAAGAVYFMVPRLLDRPAEATPAPQPVRIAAGDVLVAARPLPAGTILKGDDVRWQRWPEEGFDSNFLMRDRNANAKQDAVGRVVLRGFTPGEPITEHRLLKPGEAGFLAAALSPGMRAVSVRIDAVAGGAGFIVPGDRVDVLLAERHPIMYAGEVQSGTRPTHKQVNTIVLRDLRVLAIDQEMRDLDNKPKIASTATLEVGIKEAQKLALAPQMGSIALALRSLTRSDEPEAPAGLLHDIEISSFLGSVMAKPASAGPRIYRGSGAAGQGH